MCCVARVFFMFVSRTKNLPFIIFLFAIIYSCAHRIIGREYD